MKLTQTFRICAKFKLAVVRLFLQLQDRDDFNALCARDVTGVEAWILLETWSRRVCLVNVLHGRVSGQVSTTSGDLRSDHK